MTIALANTRAVAEATAQSIGPSRRWTCQSSGRVITSRSTEALIAKACSQTDVGWVFGGGFRAGVQQPRDGRIRLRIVERAIIVNFAESGRNAWKLADWATAVGRADRHNRAGMIEVWLQNLQSP